MVEYSGINRVKSGLKGENMNNGEYYIIFALALVFVCLFVVLFYEVVNSKLSAKFRKYFKLKQQKRHNKRKIKSEKRIKRQAEKSKDRMYKVDLCQAENLSADYRHSINGVDEHLK